MLVVHSRWVYNFMGIILEAHVCFIFRCYAFFSKICFRFGWFSKPMCYKRQSYRESTTCKLVCEMNRGTHSKSGKGRIFLIPDANSCIDCEPHKGWPRFTMNASIHLTHLFACSAFSMTVSYNT